MSRINKVRRHLLTALGLGIGASALSKAASGDTVKEQNGKLIVEVDVAVLGHTNYDNEEGAHNRDPDYANQVEDQKAFIAAYRRSDLRGSTFFHEGLVYPAGTFPEPKGQRDVNWNFEAEPIGTFFDRGWAVINNRSEGPYVPRADPHLLSHTDYYLGGIVGPDNLTPPDMIATVGLQHDNGMQGKYLRAVVGGTGKYASARGQLIQTPWGNNSSILQGRFLPPGVKPPSPNFRIRFELSV